MPDIAISVRNLSKCYRVFENQRSRLMHAVFPRYQGGAQEVWALRDVSFDLPRGESLGVIGRNGGGKSTLLEMLCGTLTPTSGEIEVSGRVSALLELGSGFNPEFSGRDNVILNGLLLGLTREEMLRRFDEILDFAEIGEAIDRPVKTYSSGMLMRLAFAVQVLCDPEILIVDEALSVGDFFFQQKCFARLRKLRDDGLTLLFVSHDMGTVRNLCPSALHLRNGRTVFMGESSLAIKSYLAEGHVPESSARPSSPAEPAGIAPRPMLDAEAHALWRRDPPEGDSDALLSVTVADAGGAPSTTVRIGEVASVIVRCRLAPNSDRHVNVLIKNRYDQLVTCCGTYQLGIPLLAADGDCYRTIRFDVRFAIEAGLYSLRVTQGEILASNQGRLSDDTGWLGPITVQWDYDNDPAPFLGMFGLPITASVESVTPKRVEHA